MKLLNHNKENVIVDSVVADRCALSSCTSKENDHSTRVNNIHGQHSYSIPQNEPMSSVYPSSSILMESTPKIVRFVGKRRKLCDLPRSGHFVQIAAKCSSQIITPRSNSRVNYINPLEGSQDKTTLSDVTNSDSASFSRNMLRGKENYLGFGRALFADEIVIDDEEESKDFNEGPNVVVPSLLSDDSEGSDYEASGCESSDDADFLSWSLDGNDEDIVDGMNSNCNLMQSTRAPRGVIPEEYASLGGPPAICSKCHAQLRKEERVNKNVTKGCPIFSLCCMKCAMRLPSIPPTPEYLLDLYNKKRDHSINNGRAPYVYRLNGQNYHVFGYLIPNDNETPKFCQLYIYDTINEVDNRLRWISVHDRESVDKEITLKVFISESGRECHISSTDEVAGIMVGDTKETCGDRDIVVNGKGKGLVRVSYIHPKLMALQYPLLLPRGEDGFHPKIKFQKTADSSCKARSFLSLKNYYSYTFQIREADGKKMMEYVPGCIAPNCPDIISGVFRLKLNQLMVDIRDKKHFGVCVGVMYVIEFQKRGLPHVYMLIWLDAESKKNLKKNVDKFVSAEIPDPLLDLVGYRVVKEFIIHSPCGLQNVKSPCMKDLYCIRHFPKKYCARTTFDDSGFPMYMRRRTNIIVEIRKVELDNQWPIEFLDKNFTFRANEALGKVAAREKNKFSKLEAFFYLNSVDVNTRKYTYDEIPRFYVWNDGERKWSMTKHGFQIYRLCCVHHSTGEPWFLHLFLTKVRGATFFESLHTVNVVSYSTFHDACKEYGLLDDDKEWHEVLTQASAGGLPPQTLWSTHWNSMVDNILHRRRQSCPNTLFTLNDTQLRFYALGEIDELLRSVGKSLKKFDQLPQPPPSYLNNGTNNLIIEETSYDTGKMDYETAKLLQDCKIVLPVASLGIAATLMPGGRTAHSRFKIPIVLDECSTCNISHDSDIAQLDIMKAVDLERYAMPFGGITVVLGGDFRQILPVITY
ncbi:uncharacterized protein LOC141666143 [Apium graveolens]|uniref:uncharacterized protein LOC141666143 n=1 Tax=Apium graveolens TaxID=4045 RepID=UPI003D7B85FB